MAKNTETEKEAEDVVEWVGDEISSAADFVSDRPLTSLAIAAAFGFLIARFVF